MVERCWYTSKDARIHQTTNTILMIAPVGFKTNAETAQDNYFMHKHNMTPDQVEAKVWATGRITYLIKAHLANFLYSRRCANSLRRISS